MATVSIDSELMTNYISAVPVPAGSHHVTVLDETRMPMVFCLSNDRPLPRLQVLRRDINGHSQMFDVGELLNLPKGAYIQTFHVEQSWNLKLYVAIGYRDGSDDSKSNLHLVKPFLPERLHADSEKLSSIPPGFRLGTIQRIYMSPISGQVRDVKFPDVFLLHRQLDQSSSWGSDISHIHIQSNYSGWFATQELDTPENVSEILDIAPATSPYGQGLYVLYVTQGLTKLYARYLRPDPNATDGTMYTFTTSVSCPPGAQCIASVLNKDGNTCLLITEPQGIRFLTTAQSTSKDQPGKLILTGSIMKNIREFFTVQDKEDVTLWFRNAKGELGYARAKANDIAETAVSSMLLPADMSSAFAPVVSSRDEMTGQAVRQMVISNDRNGQLMLIEQSDDIGLWRKTPFYKPSKSEPTPLKSYTVTIKAKDEQGSNLSFGALRISASTTVSLILNGRNILLTAIPTWLDCDQSGSLDFIIPSDSLGAQVLTIEKVRSESGDILDFAEIRYDASHKPMKLLQEKLEQATTTEQFQEMKTQSGEELLGSDVKEDEKLMEGARSCLSTVTLAYGSMNSKTISGTDSAEFRSVSVRAIASARSSGASVEDTLMDGLFWVREKIDDAVEWVIEAAGTVWKFVCTLAGEIREFVLDTVEKICEAATWIWEKIKVGWQKLVDFIGFLFSWGDILATKDTISSTITAGFGCAALKMDDLSLKVDKFFTNLETTIDRFGTTIKLDKQLNEGASSKDKKIKDTQNSTSSNWATERLKNGGAASDTKVDFKGEKTDNGATSFWEQTVMPEVEKLNAALSKVGQDITQMYRKEGSIDGNDVVNLSKDLLKTGIVAVRGIVKGLLGLVKVFIGKLSELGNATIDIPIISWLYSQITDGHALTLFDAISLIIAIPTTIFAKLITGKAPPKFQNMDAKLMKSLVDDGDVSEQVKADWAIFRAEVVVGITLTSGTIGIIKLLYKTATQDMDQVLDALKTGPSSLFDIFGIVVDTIGCIMAIPEEVDMPGAEYRHAMSGVALFRGIYHTVTFFAKAGPAAEKVVLALDLLTVLANLGLSIAIGVAEIDAANKWKDYSEEATSTNFVTAGLNTLAGIAYFTAFFFKEQPEVSAVGAAVMVGTMAGATALQGIVFKLQYDKTQRAALTSPPGY